MNPYIFKNKVKLGEKWDICIVTKYHSMGDVFIKMGKAVTWQGRSLANIT